MIVVFGELVGGWSAVIPENGVSHNRVFVITSLMEDGPPVMCEPGAYV